MTTVKQLPMLRSLRIHTFNKSESQFHRECILRALCSSPFLTKLAKLSLDWLVTAGHISILVQLPSLTMLDAPIRAAAAPQLPLLTQLKALNFSLGHIQSDPFLSFIPQLHQLTDLTLFRCSLNDEQGALIMAGCKQLTSLYLEFVRLQSLNWLVTQDSSANLLSLWLLGCRGTDASAMTSIHSLQSLQKLTLQSCCRLDDAVVHALTPPSTLLPNLTRFDYHELEA